MKARALPACEWHRLADTGCIVDRRWKPSVRKGFVLCVEDAGNIIATAFVFSTAEDTNQVDGLWVDARYRHRVSVLRLLRGVIKQALEQLGGSQTIPTDAAVWMTRPMRRAHGVRL